MLAVHDYCCCHCGYVLLSCSILFLWLDQKSLRYWAAEPYFLALNSMFLLLCWATSRGKNVGHSRNLQYGAFLRETVLEYVHPSTDLASHLVNHISALLFPSATFIKATFSISFMFQFSYTLQLTKDYQRSEYSLGHTHHWCYPKASLILPSRAHI